MYWNYLVIMSWQGVLHLLNKSLTTLTMFSLRLSNLRSSCLRLAKIFGYHTLISIQFTILCSSSYTKSTQRKAGSSKILTWRCASWVKDSSGIKREARVPYSKLTKSSICLTLAFVIVVCITSSVKPPIASIEST